MLKPSTNFYTVKALGETEIAAKTKEEALKIAELYFETKNSLEFCVEEHYPTEEYTVN